MTNKVGIEMGLGFRCEGYDCQARWSYSGFHSFRKKIASSIGIDLEEMNGFRKRHPIDQNYIQVGTKSWDDVKSPIKHFLSHSDSDGFLSPEQCNIIAPILKMILVLWEDDFTLDKQNGFSLIAAMEYCAANNKTLNFC